MIWTYPLNWPPGWPKSTSGPGTFKVGLVEAEQELVQELDRLNTSNAYLSSDNPVTASGRPKNDFGQGKAPVVLHFSRAGQELTIPCDKFSDLRGNVRAIGLTLEAIRRMERYGTSQMMDAALSGFAALPAQANGGGRVRRPWHEVLGVAPDASPELIKAAYKVAQAKTHPDVGGNNEAFQEVQDAYQEAIR
jgi:hypothetical protein